MFQCPLAAVYLNERMSDDGGFAPRSLVETNA